MQTRYESYINNTFLLNVMLYLQYLPIQMLLVLLTNIRKSPFLFRMSHHILLFSFQSHIHTLYILLALSLLLLSRKCTRDFQYEIKLILFLIFFYGVKLTWFLYLTIFTFLVLFSNIWLPLYFPMLMKIQTLALHITLDY